MSHKRKKPDAGSTHDGHASTKRPRFQASKPTDRKSQKGRAKSRRADDTTSEQQTDSVAALKSRTRDLRRLLKHVENVPSSRMPAGVRIERERELATCEHELAEKEAAGREAEYRNKIIGKYHHIRFFERQKASRTVKKLHKKLKAAERQEEKDDLTRRIRNFEVDVNYTIYYPLLKPYVSLYPKTREGQEGSSVAKPESIEGPKGDVVMWERVKTATEEGTLETLRNSKDGLILPRAKDSSTLAKQPKKSIKPGEKEQQTTHGHASSVDKQDEDSDGGFFE